MLVYVSDAARATVPVTIEGVRTVVIQTRQEAVALGTAPLDSNEAGDVALPPSALSHAIRVKQQ